VSRLLDLFGGSSLEATLTKARRRLAAGHFDDAQKIVTAGLVRFPDSDSLRETELTIRRAQARAGMQSLKSRIAMHQDAHAYEQLIQLYLEIDMPEEARREMRAYVQAHPDRDTPHLLLGEAYLQSFFEDMSARDAHSAHDHLVRAARLNPEAVKPRLLLAELYFCVGADRSLAVVTQALERFAEKDPALGPVLAAIRETPTPGTGPESVDGLFEKAETTGRLMREATAWPLRTRRHRQVTLAEDRMRSAAVGIVSRGEAAEVVVLRRGGSVLAHVLESSGESPRLMPTDGQPGEAAGLVGIAQTVSKTVAPLAREFDLGAFRRCAIQGAFGTIVVGPVGGTLAGARSRAREVLRLWERVAVGLEGALGGRKP
jgi:hypothetical protein